MSKFSGKLRMYPRGFLGSDVQAQSERTPPAFKARLNTYQYTVAIADDSANKIPGNPFVESLYSAYIRQSANVGSFDYREKVIVAALDAFGTDRFDVWYLSQLKSPALGNLHGDFLLDTLKYIETGKRDVSLETWQSLLAITDEGNNIGKLSPLAKEFFGDTTSYEHFVLPKYPKNVELTEVIQNWLVHTAGFEDLLGTLHILFGNV
jgi:hypothetical protein